MLSIRQKTMLQSVLGHPEGISSRQLSELLRVSGKTVRNDMTVVNQWLKEFDCCVSASQRSGYFIEEDNKDKINHILESLNQPEQSREVQTPQERRFAVLDRVLGRPGTSIYILAERLCVSEQTIYKDIGFLERILKERYDFQGLAVQNGRIFMQAPEYEIRRLVFCLLTNRILESGQLMDNCLYNLMRGIVNLSEIHTFYQYVEEYCRGKGIIISDQLLYICAWIIFYTNVRREEMFFLDNRAAFDRSDGLADFLRAMNQDFFLELEACDLEVIYQFLMAFGFPGGSSELGGESEALFLDFQERLEYQYGISLASEAQIQESFRRNLTNLLHRIRLRAQLGPEAADRISEWPETVRQAVLLLRALIYKRCGGYLKAGELSWIAEYLMVSGNGHQPAVRALILYGADEGRYYRVRRFIREQFQQEVFVCGACPQYMLEEACRENKPDLLIATQPADIRTEMPNLTLSGSLSEEEKRRIKSFLEDMAARKRRADADKFLDSQVQVRFLEGRLSLEEAAAECRRLLIAQGCIHEEDPWDYWNMMADAVEGGRRQADRCWLFLPVERRAISDGISICVTAQPDSPVRAVAAAALMPKKRTAAGCSGYGREAVCGALRRLFRSPEQVERLLKLTDQSQVLGLIREALSWKES